MEYNWRLHQSRECRQCERLWLRYTDTENEQLCHTGRKLVAQYQAAQEVWRGITPQFDCGILDGWEAYDAHSCTSRPACVIRREGFGPQAHYYRAIRCPLGYKLADERFRKLGY